MQVQITTPTSVRFTDVPDPDRQELPETVEARITTTRPAEHAAMTQQILPYLVAAVEEASKPLWIVVYHHRHGTDVWPVYQEEEPDEVQRIKLISQYTTYEGPLPEEMQDEDYDPDDDEWTEAVGPWRFDPHSPGKRG
jgi:hypothetical protein